MTPLDIHMLATLLAQSQVATWGDSPDLRCAPDACPECGRILQYDGHECAL